MVALQPLEPRRLLTVLTAEYDATTQIVSIVGNDKRDIIELTPLPDGGVSAAFDAREVQFPGPITMISIITGDAGDLISVGTLDIPCSIDAGKGPDTVGGSLTDDTLIGGGGFDIVLGSLGSDSISGGLQGDLLVAGRGDDSIIAASDDNSDDTITGGPGRDTVDYSEFGDVVVADIGVVQPGPNESDNIQGDVEILIGSPQSDRITNGTKRGMRLEGGGGDDTITGGSGNDTLIGDAGTNSLMGVGGNDTFILAANSVNDVKGGSGSDSVQGGDGDDTITEVP